MSELVRCPDCGGIVGATEPTDEGAPCTCFTASPQSQTPSLRYSEDSDSPHATPNDSFGTEVMNSPPAEKVCCKCGKDLTGKKRLKDSLGYWCPDCHRADEKSKEVQGVKCEQCGRIVPGQSLTSSDGKKICSRCLREDRALRAPGSKRFRPIDDKNFKETDKKSLIILASILGILALIILISHFLH
jgi:hypothetical protein